MVRWFRIFLKNRKRSARKRSDRTARATNARYANWTVGATAALLVLLSAGGYFYHRKQLETIVTEHPRLIVVGPSHIQAGMGAKYTIKATTIDGWPLPAEIEVVLSKPNGDMIKAFKEPVDTNGRLTITIPADMKLPPQVKLQVAATHKGSTEEMESILPVYSDDFNANPPKAIGDRSVDQLANRRLNVRLVDADKQYPSGKKVKLSLQATDETERPVSAALSVAVLKCVPKEHSPSSTASGAEDFDKSSEFRELSVSGHPNAKPSLIFDNGEKVRANYEKCLAEYQGQRTAFWDTLTAASFFGGLGLVVLVAMLGLMRIVLGMHLWVSAIGATTCCMILGAILMDPVTAPHGHGSDAVFTSIVFSPRENTSSATDGSASPIQVEILSTIGSDNDFIETIYWNPLLVADADGRAEIEFSLPPGEATYAVIVESHGEGRIGVDRMDFVVGQPEVDAQKE